MVAFVPEAVDEHPHPGHFLVLLPLCLPQAGDAGVPFRQVGAVDAAVDGQRPQPDLGDLRDHAVEEVAIVRDQHHRVRIVDEELLQPVARLEVEVVGRLVEQQQPGPAEQQLGQCDAHLPAAGERLGGAFEVGGGEAEPAQDRVHLRLDAVAVPILERVLDLAVARQGGVVLARGHTGVSELRFERAQLRLQREQRLERPARLLVERPAGVGQPILRQVADRQAVRPRNLARVGLDLPGQHLEQRRLAGPVRAAEADALAVLNLPGDLVEQHPVAEGLVKVGDVEHRNEVRLSVPRIQGAGVGRRGDRYRYNS